MKAYCVNGYAEQVILNSYLFQQKRIQERHIFSDSGVVEFSIKIFSFSLSRHAETTNATENQATGVTITQVVSGAPGQYPGFELGDKILAINGASVANEQAISDALTRADQNARITVLCGRTGQTIDVDVAVK